MRNYICRWLILLLIVTAVSGCVTRIRSTGKAIAGDRIQKQLKYNPELVKSPRWKRVKVSTIPPGMRVYVTVGWEFRDNWQSIHNDDDIGDFLEGHYIGISPCEFLILDRGYSYVDFKFRGDEGKSEWAKRFGEVPDIVTIDTTN